MSQLPDDGDLTDKCGVGIEDTAEKQEEEELPSEDTDPTDVATFIPVVARKMTEKETIRKSVHHRQPTEDQIVPWPENGSVPIDEFKTEGYISCAFPMLFPTGEADYLAPRLQSVTVGMYFKHLMMYGEGRFAKHPRFRYFALNTEMRWRALQTGRVYINQHPDDARLTLDDLRDMVGHEGEFFTHRVMHFASSLRGTSQFWFKQRSRLISMVDTLGMPTADGQWPELARLICPDKKDSSTSRSKAVSDNPAIADWFFYHCISKFVDTFYTDVMGAVDFWYRFEWQHRGSPHVHGIAWFADAPDVQHLLAAEDYSDLIGGVENVTSYADSIVSTINPAISMDGSNAENAPLPQTKPHVCNKSYSEVEDIKMDLTELIATCQRHTRCSPAYFLKKKKKGVQECRFGYPKPLQPVTTIDMEGAVAEHNVAKLRASGQPIAVLSALHTGPSASKATSDDAGGLEPVICIAHGARVMLSANVWVEVGLVNGALGTVEAICYEGDQRPPNLPIAVTIKFDSYSGPTLPDGTVPITPLRRTWFSTTKPCSRLQIPLKLAWAVTIHKFANSPTCSLFHHSHFSMWPT